MLNSARRRNRHRWESKPSIPQVLGRIQGTDELVYFGKLNAVKIQGALNRLGDNRPFSSVRAYNEETDKGKTFCPNPCCSAELFAVKPASREGALDYNDGHGQSTNVDKHIKGCQFKNEKRQNTYLSVRKAVDRHLDIIFHVEFDYGFRSTAPTLMWRDLAGRPHSGTSYEKWQDEHAGKDYCTQAVHSLDEIVAGTNKIDIIGGPAALMRASFQRHGMVLPYDQINLVQSETQLSETQIMRNILTPLFGRAKRLQDLPRNGPYVQIAGRITEFRRADVEGDNDRIIHGTTVNMGLSGVVQQFMSFTETPAPAHLYNQFLLYAAPRVYLGETVAERRHTVRIMDDILNNKNMNPHMPKSLAIEWVMSADPSAQISAVPQTVLPSLDAPRYVA